PRWAVTPFEVVRWSAGDDVEGDLGLHLGVQADEGLRRADVLDRGRDLDRATVDLRATTGLDRLGDLTAGDCAEETARLARVGGDRDLLGLEVALDGLRL